MLSGSQNPTIHLLDIKHGHYTLDTLRMPRVLILVQYVYDICPNEKYKGWDFVVLLMDFINLTKFQIALSLILMVTHSIPVWLLEQGSFYKSVVCTLVYCDLGNFF
jgi:hypothetical protein